MPSPINRNTYLGIFETTFSSVLVLVAATVSGSVFTLPVTVAAELPQAVIDMINVRHVRPHINFFNFIIISSFHLNFGYIVILKSPCKIQKKEDEKLL